VHNIELLSLAVTTIEGNRRIMEEFRIRFLMVLNLVLLIMIRTSTNSQGKVQIDPKDLVGIWQADTAEEGSAWLDAYSFFPDGRFIFHFSQYNGTHRIEDLHGNFKIEGNVLYTTIQYRTERIGGHVERGGNGSEDEWVLVGDSVVVVKQENLLEEKWPLKLYQRPSDGIKCLNLRRNYYLVRKNPDDY
jgi:hypothetical protein